MTAASKSTLLLVLVCAIWMGHSGVVIAQEEGTTPAAAEPTVGDNAHEHTGTGPMSAGETTPQAEGTTTTTTTTTAAPTQPQTTMPPTTTSTMPSPTSTTMAPSTASSTMATSTAKQGTPAAHNQVAENTTTAAPVTTTPKPSSASIGAVLSVATLVFGLCLVHM